MEDEKNTRHFHKALELAKREPWEGAIPKLDGASLKIGILVQMLVRHEPRIFEDQTDELVDIICASHPTLVEKFAEFDWRAVAFVMRTQRLLAADRGPSKR